MQKLRNAISARLAKDTVAADSRNNSLDTNSSMNTIETDATWHTSSSGDFPDCPFVCHKLYSPIAEMFKQSMGLVYLARRRDTGERVVIKLVDRGTSITRHVQSELLLHRQCNGHPFFTQLRDVFITPRHLAIVQEHVAGGDVLELVNSRKGLPEEEARWLFQQLLIGMMYLHSLGADNREMKLDNKLLYYGADCPSAPAPQPSLLTPRTSTITRMPTVDSNATASTELPVAMSISTAADPLQENCLPVLKLQDFAYSKSEQINSDPNSALGSLPYTAPEVLSNSMKEGTSADVWSLGVALYKMVTGLYPFERPQDEADPRIAVQAVLTRIAKVDYFIPENLSPSLRDLLGRMLVRSPEQRIDMADIRLHPWVTKDMPAEMANINASVNPDSGAVSEEHLLAVLEEAKINLHPLDSENVEELADEFLNEEEADDLLDELALG